MQQHLYRGGDYDDDEGKITTSHDKFVEARCTCISNSVARGREGTYTTGRSTANTRTL